MSVVPSPHTLQRGLLPSPHYRLSQVRKQPEHHQCRAAVKQTLRVEIDKIPSQVLDSVEAESQPLPEVEVPAVSATIDLADISPTSSVDSVVDLHDYNEDSESETDEPSGSAEDVSDHGQEWAGETVMPPHEQEGLQADLAGMSLSDLCGSDRAYNVELSWLAFNWRVISLASAESTPLLERLQFIAIASRNLDEFFAKRVGGLMRQVAAGTTDLKGTGPEKWLPEQQLNMIAGEVSAMVAAQGRALHGEVLPALRSAGIRILTYSELSSTGAERLNKYFQRELELLLTPIKLDPAHPFPYLPSGSLNLAVTLEDPREQSGDPQFASNGHPLYAIVNIPPSFSRWYEVPPSAAQEGDSWQQAFMPVEQIIEHNLGQLFGGAIIKAVHVFRVTRNADLERHEEEADDLLDMVADELRERRFAPFVRLEVAGDMPGALALLLTEELKLDTAQNVLHVHGLLDMAHLSSLPVNKRKLEKGMVWPAWKPREHPRLVAPLRRKRLRKRRRWAGPAGGWAGTSIFRAIRSGDVLVQHPYHNFGSSTQRFVEEAAADPSVAAIKATLYRTNSDSPIITALLKAAEQGKQVTVVVELKARFDEARNVGYAQRLEDAGCNVAWGLLGSKTHCKLMLAVRREREAPHGLRTYVHVGTGNYNPSTAAVYTDLGLLSCRPAVCNDVVDIFKHLTGLHNQVAVGGYRTLLVAKEAMRGQFAALLEAEVAAARRGQLAAVCIKVNGLDDKTLTRKLYEAAAAGVRIDAIVRGICRLRAGVPGLSEGVRVVSVVGRFLEHHRIYAFLNCGAPRFFIGSADWMNRNLMKRVEVAVPIEDEALQRQLRDVLALCLYDGVDAWDMTPAGQYAKPAYRRAEAPLAVPLLGADESYLKRMQKLGETMGCQAALMKLTDAEGKRPLAQLPLPAAAT